MKPPNELAGPGSPAAQPAREDAGRDGASDGASDALSVRAGRDLLLAESAALAEAARRLGPAFARASAAIRAAVESGGKVITTGVGKSGLAARKIASTLTSLGSTAVFLHPVDALHGDLGTVRTGDVVIAVSNSGTSAEVLALVRAMEPFAPVLIALTGNPLSSLARASSIVLDASVRDEGSPWSLAPAASSAVAVGVGDALAAAVCRLRGLTAEDFALSHPGGSIGRRLSLRVRDLMHSGGDLPVVRETDRMSEAILTIAGKRLGMTAVVNAEGRLTGIITDGDLKRLLLRHRDIMDLAVASCMTPAPRTIGPDESVSGALMRMEADPGRLITSLVVVDDAGELHGVIHLHDCLQACLS